MPEILLLTNRFPYGSGEEYLEPELPHLTAAFDRVTIVPTMQTRGQHPTRTVPRRVTVLPLELPPGRTGRVRLTLEGLRTGAVRPGLPHLPEQPLRPVARLYEAYFEARSQAIARRTLVRLDQAGLEIPGIVYSYWFYVTARVADLVADGRPAGRPVVVSRAHGYDVNVAASPVRHLPQRSLLLSHLDRVHPVAEVNAHRLREEHPAHAAKVTSRRLGCRSTSDVPVARQDPFHVLTVSTVRPLKRLDLVADAVEILQREGIPVRWTHLGGGSPGAVRDLHRRVARLTPGSVDLAGPVPHSQVLQRYAALRPSVLVNVSTSEGVPVSVMEAMAHGVPVLATDVGGTGELLGAQPELDLLPAHLDGEWLADALRQVVDLPAERYEEVCVENLRTWQQGWDADVVLGEFARELAALAGRAGPAGVAGPVPA